MCSASRSRLRVTAMRRLPHHVLTTPRSPLRVAPSCHRYRQVRTAFWSKTRVVASTRRRRRHSQARVALWSWTRAGSATVKTSNAMRPQTAGDAMPGAPCSTGPCSTRSTTLPTRHELYWRPPKRTTAQPDEEYDHNEAHKRTQEELHDQRKRLARRQPATKQRHRTRRREKDNNSGIYDKKDKWLNTGTQSRDNGNADN